jgi:hypothetical protein
MLSRLWNFFFILNFIFKSLDFMGDNPFTLVDFKRKFSKINNFSL